MIEVPSPAQDGKVRAHDPGRTIIMIGNHLAHERRHDCDATMWAHQGHTEPQDPHE